VNTPTLDTERLILRRFTEKDMEALFLILKDEEVNRFLPWYALKSIEETKEFLNSMGGAKVCILVFLLKDNYEDFTTVVEGTSAAIQNMCLMAYDKGLATCWLTAALRVGIGEELRQKFAPDKGQYLAMLTLGYPAISPKMPPRRGGRYVII